MNKFQDAVNQILRGMKFMIADSVENTTKIYDGLVIQVNNNDTCDIVVNNQTYILPIYNGNGISAGKIAKVFVPQGNMNLAFVI